MIKWKSLVHFQAERMKTLTFCLLVSGLPFSRANSWNDNSSKKHLTPIFENIISELSGSVFDLTFINNDSERKNINFNVKVLSDKNICANIAGKAAIAVVKLSDSGILLFKDINELKSFYDHFLSTIQTRRFMGRLLYYVYTYNISYEDLFRFKLLHRRFFEFFYFIVEDESSFKLLTTVWYSPEACNMFQLVVVNTYSKIEKRWRTNNFKIKKFDNFHGCQVKICSLNANITTMSSQLQLNVVFDLARKLNYSALYLQEKTKNHDIDISKLVPIQSIHNMGNFSIPPISQPFLFRDSLLAVPVGKKYNGYEKLLLPYESAVWSWIIVTFAAAFSTIFVLKFTAQTFRRFIIGSTTKTPTLNVLRIFFGASQIKSPGRNFARFLAMLFIIYSMIIRTAWQGKMFEFMQKEMRKAEVKSISEMSAKNFTFFIQLNFFLNNNYRDLFPRK